MFRKLQLTAIFLVILAAAGGAAGLDSNEVVIVANANSKESVSLAKFYAAQRGIPASHICLIKTTLKYNVSRKDFESQIRLPIGHFLIKHKLAAKTRCLCLMWGVPVRVMGPGILRAYQIGKSKSHHELAMDHKLLATVCRKFPAPRTKMLEPVGKLFESPMPPPTRPLLTGSKLLAEFARLLAEKETKIASLTDPAKHRIARRQLLSLRLDAYGLTGLIRYIESHKSPGAPKLAELQARLKKAKDALDKLPKKKITPELIRKKISLMNTTGGAALVYTEASKQARLLGKRPADAAVDSELSLLWWRGHPLFGWTKNPLHWRVAPLLKGKRVPPALMAARIDGPTSADAMRIIKASLATEKTGLKGRFYIDAGGKHKKYDAHFKTLAALMRKNTSFQTILDTKPTLFAAGSCPDAALYVGWYSLKRYVPAFIWSEGAVGWHVASFEAMHLRNSKSSEWCVKMIQNGVAATLGAVAEPYLGSFPLPEEFFPLLLTGKYTVAECYWRTTPMASWRMTLIADPLYNPFKADPHYKLKDLPAGLAP